mmetsp:Transcript_31149/g.71768  ORF Transcript_31149/g.71768 Transcript_31149/m.71768 type:complete len:84 (-) Transcript_31149:122-373(-)
MTMRRGKERLVLVLLLGMMTYLLFLLLSENQEHCHCCFCYELSSLLVQDVFASAPSPPALSTVANDNNRVQGCLLFLTVWILF